jgi:hypothetical protein
MFRLKTGNIENLIHSLSSTGINNAFNIHQYMRCYHTGNDTIQRMVKQESNKVIPKLK